MDQRGLARLGPAGSRLRPGALPRQYSSAVGFLFLLISFIDIIGYATAT